MRAGPIHPDQRLDAATIGALEQHEAAAERRPSHVDAPALVSHPSRRHRLPLARRTILAAIALGGAAEFILLRDVPWGVSLPLLVTVLLGAILWLLRFAGRPVTVGSALLTALALAHASVLAWRDDGAVAFLNLLALVGVLAALGAALRHGGALPVDRAGPADYILGAARQAAHALLGAPALAAAARAPGSPSAPAGTDARVSPVLALVRGGLLAFPVLALFGLLLGAADPAFAHLAGRAVAFHSWKLAGHAALAALGAWLAAGWLHGALVAEPGDAAPIDWLPRLSLRPRPTAVSGVGIAEACVALGLVDLLFGAFVLVQASRLLGGDAMTVAGVTRAEYAREGFFELVAVSVLALPLLLAAHTLARPADARPRLRLAFRLAVGAMLALLLLIALSAAERMRLYQSAFGLTQARVHASAVMGWLALVFAWAAATLLRDRPAPFALGALVSGWLGALLLAAADPVALVARVNADRLERGQRFDAHHAARLGADATPVHLARTLPLLIARGRQAEACLVARALLAQATFRGDGWRTWNGARARATELVRENERWLRRVTARNDGTGNARAGEARASRAFSDTARGCGDPTTT